MKSAIILGIAMLAVIQMAYAASPHFYKGYAFVNGSLAPNGTIVQVFVNGASSAANTATVGRDLLADTREGWYTISFEANANDNVTFKLNGAALNSNNGSNSSAQAIYAGQIITEGFNLSIATASNGAACTYASGCSGGYCVHSICRAASTYCGDNYCDAGESCSSDNSACSSGYACTNGCAATGGGSGSSGSGNGPPASTGANKTTTNGTTTITTPGGTVITKTVSGETHSITITNPGASIVRSFTSTGALKQIEISVSNKVKNMTITVTKLDSQPASITKVVVGKVFQYLQIDHDVSDADIQLGKIRFNVTKSWLSSNNFAKQNVFLERYSGNWQKLTTSVISESSSEVEYEATTPGFSVFAIAAETPAAPSVPPARTQPAQGSPWTAIVEGLVVLIIIVAAFYWYYFRAKRTSHAHMHHTERN